MEELNLFFERLYDDFNDRNIESVIADMTADVKWANGMDGGFVYGHEGVRQYWTKQFTLVSSHVKPLRIEHKNGTVRIEVHQVVHDLNRKLLADETVEHIFYLKDDKISEFNIGQKLK